MSGSQIKSGIAALLTLLLATACGTTTSVNMDDMPDGGTDDGETGFDGLVTGVIEYDRPDDCEVGDTDGSSVLLMGDSYVALNNKAFGAELMRLARADGSLADDDAYADRSVAGTQLAGPSFLGLIPTQYDAENNSDGHVTTVVMDGGGNDVLVGNRSCIDDEAPPGNESCVDTLNGAFDVAAETLDLMANDGVENVVYFFYPHLPGGGLGGDEALTNATIDYAIDRTDGMSAISMCENAPLNCTFVDARGLFPAETAEFQDGIHPTVENTEKISAQVWQIMKRDCISQ